MLSRYLMYVLEKNSLELIMLIDFYHLKKSKISYLMHGIRVSKISLGLIYLGIVGFIHALLPFIFLETVSSGVKKINREISQF